MFQRKAENYPIIFQRNLPILRLIEVNARIFKINKFDDVPSCIVVLESVAPLKACGFACAKGACHQVLEIQHL